MRSRRRRRLEGGAPHHIVTDTEGFLLAVRVHEANIQEWFQSTCRAPVIVSQQDGITTG
jgi:hypothetical protein